MQLKEGFPQEFVNYKPEDYEVMAGFVNSINGPFPIEESELVKGLKVAAEIAPFLGVFIDEKNDGLTQVANSALGTLETMGLIVRKDGNWVVPDSGNPIDNPLDQLHAKARMVFTKEGINVFQQAADAARQVWSAGKSK